MPSKRIHRRFINESGHAHELTFSCFQKFPFLSKERTCEWLADSIRTASRDLEFSIWAFVFMPEHVHLIVHPRKHVYDIAQFVAGIKQPVSRRAISFLRREAPEWLEKIKLERGNRTEFHFWQTGGGFDRNITAPRTLEKMIEYIHMNPVRKGLVAKATDWKWSSAKWFLQDQQHEHLPVDPIPSEWTIGMSDE